MDVRNQTTSGPATPLAPNPTPVNSEVAALERASISWKAIFAGALLSLLTYGILMSLGFAIGGSELQDVIRGESAQGLGVGSAIWIALSVFISLFVGSYFGSRVAGFITTRIGAVQGAVVAALFFGFMLTQLVSAVGLLGKGLGSTVGAIGGAAGTAASNPDVQETISQSLQGETLKAPPGEVIQGIATRLLKGDTQGAKDYLVQNSSLTDEKADQIISDVQQNIGPAAEKVAQAGARGVSIAGWTFFLAMTFGTFFAIVGGAAGARARLRAPFSAAEARDVRKTRTAA